MELVCIHSHKQSRPRPVMSNFCSHTFVVDQWDEPQHSTSSIHTKIFLFLKTSGYESLYAILPLLLICDVNPNTVDQVYFPIFVDCLTLMPGSVNLF